MRARVASGRVPCSYPVVQNERGFPFALSRALEEVRRPRSLTRENLVALLGKLAAQGALRARATEDAAPRITAVGILTCDRPQHIEKAVTSYLRAADQGRRPLSIVVMDDSNDERTRAANRSQLARLREASGADIRYADDDARRAYLQVLAQEASVSQDLLEFAL